MTTRTLGGMAAALLAAAGLCRGATSDNPNQVAPAKPQGAVAAAPADGEWESIATSFGGSKADTRPSQDVTMQFTFAAEVREINAVGGQRVKKGLVLMRARDAEVIAAKERQRDKASNETEIQGAEQQLKNAEFKFNMIEKSGTYAPTEYEDAKNAAVVARLQLQQARKNKVQEELSFKQIEAQHERYWLEAPFDGIIEEVMVEVGEGVTEQTKVLRVVNTEKMRLDPYADTRETIRLGLKEGSPAWVLIDMPDAPKLVRGKVLYVSPVADSVSQTRRVRVEIDNPQGCPAGTQAKVRFVEPGGEWKKYQGQPTTAAESLQRFDREFATLSQSDRQFVLDALGTNASVRDVRSGFNAVVMNNSPSNDEVRRTVAAMLEDAETRATLLAGSDEVRPGIKNISGDEFPSSLNTQRSRRFDLPTNPIPASEGTPK